MSTTFVPALNGQMSAPMANTPTTAARQEMKTAVHRALIERVDLEKIGVIKGNRSGQFVLLEAIHKLINEQGVPLTVPEREKLAQEVLDEVFGLGPLEPLLQDDTINDILVNSCKSVYIERRGVLEKTNVVFQDEAGHDVYQIHPKHLEFIDRNKPRWSAIKVFDFRA